MSETRIEITTPAQRRKKAIVAKQKERGHLVGRDSQSPAPGAREIARKLVEDPKYLRGLKKRLIAGIAGPVEVWIWRYAYGEPEKNEAERQRELERFERMREQLRHFLEKAPERAAVLDASVQRAPRLLPLPQHHVPQAEIVDPEVLGGNGRS